MPQSPRATSLYLSQRGVARLAGLQTVLWRSARAMRTLQLMTSPHGVGPGHGEPENTHGSLGMRLTLTANKHLIIAMLNYGCLDLQTD